MIGKVQDVVAGAVVIGAAEKAGSSYQAGSQQQSNGSSAAKAAEDVAKLQDEWNANPADAAKQKDDEKNKNIEKMDEQSVAEMTDELNELMDKINCNLEFKYNKEVDLMSVKMIDKTTEEVIKEFPPEEMIKNIENAREWIGAFLDKNA